MIKTVEDSVRFAHIPNPAKPRDYCNCESCVKTEPNHAELIRYLRGLDLALPGDLVTDALRKSIFHELEQLARNRRNTLFKGATGYAQPMATGVKYDIWTKTFENIYEQFSNNPYPSDNLEIVEEFNKHSCYYVVEQPKHGAPPWGWSQTTPTLKNARYLHAPIPSWIDHPVK